MQQKTKNLDIARSTFPPKYSNASETSVVKTRKVSGILNANSPGLPTVKKNSTISINVHFFLEWKPNGPRVSLICESCPGFRSSWSSKACSNACASSVTKAISSAIWKSKLCPSGGIQYYRLKKTYSGLSFRKKLNWETMKGGEASHRS